MSKNTGLALSTLLYFFLPVTFAQITGEIRGIVLDSAGAIVIKCEVTVKNLETSITRTKKVTNEGRFTFPLLPIGTFEVRAQANGFRVSATQVVVKSGEISTVPFRLQVGQVTETVTVSDIVSRLDTENAQIQNSVAGPKIQELPVNRNANLFALMSPGIAPVSANNPFLGSGSFNSNGGRGRGNNITVDGITATDVTVTGTILGPLNFSALKEVKVITTNFSAEYGRNSSSQVLYITKNGTNDLHGDLFDYFQNDKLNSRPFFDQSGKSNISRKNYFGFEAGGPVYIPKVFDGRNKVFWHTAYQGDKVRGAGATRIANVPTPAMMAQISDPTSRALVEQYQLPSTPGGQLPTFSPNTTDAHKVSVRGDINLGDKDTLWARYSRSKSTDESSSLTFIQTNLPNFGAKGVSFPQQATIQEVHLFSPSIVNEFRFGFGRGTAAFPIATPFPPGPRIVFQSAEVASFGVWEGFPQGRLQNTSQFTDNLSFTRGRHNLKTGFEYYHLVADSFIDALVHPLLTFANWAAFASGTPSIFQQRFGDSIRANRVRDAFAFLQDDVKVSRHLTLNLGLRYEFAGGPTEKNGLISNLNLNNRSAIGAAGAGPLGFFETGKPSFTSNHNWAPRLGFAWNLTGDQRTVLRGGYGVAYDFIFLNPITNQRSLPPFIVTATQTGNFTGSNAFANIVAGNSAIQTAIRGIAGKFNESVLNYGAVQPAIDEGLRNPQVHQWNLGIQRDLMGFVLKASYVGTKGNYLSRSRDINPVAAPLAPAASLADETARLDAFRAQNSGLSGGNTAYSNRLDRRFNNTVLTDSSANSNYHAAQFEMHKRFGRGHMAMANYTAAKSIDDGSDVLSVLINDSSNQQNPFDNRNNRSVSQFDLTHRFVIAHQWELPFFRDHSNTGVRTALGGWAFSGITTFRSGYPVTLDAGSRRGIGPSTVLGAGTAIRPNASGPVEISWVPANSAGAPFGTVNPDGVQPISAYANSIGLSQPLLGNFGTLGRHVHRLNGERNFDWNIYKNFHAWERAYFQVRAEGYNMFNNTSFQEANRNISQANFGQYSTVAQNARTFQLGARFVF